MKNSEFSNDIMENSINTSKLIITSMLLGLLFYIFMFKYLGVSMAVYCLIIFGVFITINKSRITTSFEGYFFLAISLALSITYGIFNNPVFRMLNIIIIPICILTSFLFFTYGKIPFTLDNILINIFKLEFINSIRISTKVPIYIIDIAKNSGSEKKKTITKGIVKGLIVAIPLLLITLSLLLGADDVFRYYVEDFIYAFGNFDGGELFKLVFSIGISLYFWGLFKSLAENEKPLEKGNSKSYNIDVISILTLLIIINILYTVFTYIQVTHLYTMNSSSLPSSFNYSEYARSGFFQLVFVAFMNIVIITVLKFIVKSENLTMNKVLNILYTLTTLYTLNMVVSAMYKMNLYIDFYGYTRLRVLVQCFTLFLGVLLVLLSIYIWYNKSMFKYGIIIGAILYVTLNFVNIDNYIAKNNITLGANDTYYLTCLSSDAYTSMMTGHKNGTIDDTTFAEWKMYNTREMKHWYQYNYYSSQLVK